MTTMLAERPLMLTSAEPDPFARTETEPVSVPWEVGGGPLRVLLVDDDEMLRSSVADLLEDMGFSVIGQAEDGERGVALAAELDPDVVLMDLRMPGMDGIEATRQIRRADQRAQVVIYSAYGEAGFQQGAEDAGVSCYLVKGCGPGILADVLRSVGSYRRQLDDPWRAGRTDPSADPRA